MEHTDCEDNGLRLLHLDSIFDQLRIDGTCVLDIENCGSLYLRFSPLQLGSVCNRLLLDASELTADNTPSVRSCESDKALIKSHSSTSCVFAQTSVQPDWEINDECVFVLTAPLHSTDREIVRWEAIDCISRRLLNHLDGLHSLPELAELAKVDLTVARLCLVHLVRSGVVRALPYPDFLSPVPRHLEATSISITMPGWLGLPRLASLLTDRALGLACLDAVHCPVGTPDTVSTVRCTLMDVFRVYTILCGSPNFSLPHLLSAIPSLHFVDVNFGNPPPSLFTSTVLSPSDLNERAEVSLLRLVQFGEINGLIHRLNCYPICADGDGKDGLSQVVQPNNIDRLPPDFSTVRLTKQQQLLHVTVSPVPSSVAKCRTTSWSIIDEQLWVKTRSSLLDGLHSVTGIGCRIASESGHVSETKRYISDLFERLYSGDASHKSGQSTIASKTPNNHQYYTVSTANSAFTPVESRTLSTAQATRSAGDQMFHRFSSIGKADTPRAAERVYCISEESPSPQKFPSDLSEINDSATSNFYFLWR
ncbi:Nitrogen permease regulator 2 protein [Paragonimus kellicotti]|nr:Nitrogen permease regulator 2 protein [Paragonimus kellicotti]